jgi:hypothetical protein
MKPRRLTSLIDGALPGPTAAEIEPLAKVKDGRPSVLDDYKPYLHQRWNEGCTNVRQLRAEVRERGCKGGCGTIRDYMLQFRQAGAANLPGRVHGDPVLQLDDLPAAPGGGEGLDAGNPDGRLRRRRSRLAGTAGLAPTCCGDSVGILKITAGACVIFTSSLPAFSQVGGADADSLCGSR